CTALVGGVGGRENRHADESHQHDDRKTPCRAIPASGQSHRGHHLLTSMMSFMSGCTAHSTSTVPALSKTMLFDPPCPYDPRSKLLTSDSENTLCENGSSLTNFTESPSFTLSFLVEKALLF